MAENVSLDERQKPPPYNSAPPGWLPKVSSSGDMGYIGFFPPVPSQDEDEITETNIKEGFKLKAIAAESLTSKSKIIKELQEDGIMNDLEDFINQVFTRRAETHSQIPATSFRAPTRATLNDAKRTAWFKDLKNADIPLYKLGKSIPHGVRGNDLLDLLFKNEVPLSRAVWFVRVLGSNETAGLRNKPNYNPMQYSTNWANVMIGYIEKQLSEIGLPSAPRAGLNIKQTFKGVFNDPDAREKWVAKFSYTLDLLRVFYNEYMIDHTLFLAWISQTLLSSNLAQAGFVLRLMEDYLGGMGSCRALLRPAINACLTKLYEIANSPAKEALASLADRSERVLQRMFFASPVAFISPTSWKAHSDRIKNAVLSISSPVLADDTSDASMLRAQVILRETFHDVERRNKALLFMTNTQPAQGQLRSMVSDVKLLNSITSKTDLTTITFLSAHSSIDETLRGKIFLLLSWSVCWLQYGDHRPYAVASLLRRWRDRTEERADRRHADSPNGLIQDMLFDWLDTSEIAREPKNISMVALLVGELIQSNLFSYDSYIQRILARGEPGLSFNEEPGSCHRMFLRVIPLYRSDAALINQRKLTLHGVRSRVIPEDDIEAKLKKELNNSLPEVFGNDVYPGMPIHTISKDSIFRSAARYEKIRVVRWFMPKLHKFITLLQETADAANILLRVYCVVFEILEAMRCYRTALDFLLHVLRSTVSTDILLATVDDLTRHLDLWACMDSLTVITQTLLDVHNIWKSKGVHIRFLVNLLLEVDSGRLLDDVSRNQLLEGAAHFAQALCPSTDSRDQVPTIMPEVLSLPHNQAPNSAAEVANALWYKYRSSRNWAYTVWDNVITGLQQSTSIGLQAADRIAVSYQYAQFLLHVDLHSADGINPHVMQWFIGPGVTVSKSLCEEAWIFTNIVFLYLSVHGAIPMSTLLRGIIFPAWDMAASFSSTREFDECSSFIEATTMLCRLLLIDQSSSDDGRYPTLDLMEKQRLRTRRKAVFQDVTMEQLIERIPSLVSIESNESSSERLRTAIRELRQSFCCDESFRLGACRNIAMVVQTFSNPTERQECQHEDLVAALRLVFNEEDEDQGGRAVLLSPWRLSTTAAITSFILQQAGRNLESPTRKDKVEAELLDLAHRLVNNSVTAQEADFVSDMVKGVNVKVATIFINEGICRISGSLQEIPNGDLHSLIDLPAKAGHYLNLISMIILPLRHGPSVLAPLDTTLQEAVCKRLAETLRIICDTLEKRKDEAGDKDIAQGLSNSALFSARLLQFILSFPDAWTPIFKGLGDELLSLLLRLALVHATGMTENAAAFTLFLDTIFYLLDDFSADTRQSSDPYAHSPSLVGLPSGIAQEHRKLLETIGRLQVDSPYTKDLVYGARDSNGTLHYGSPVQLRPWEWLETLGDHQLPEAKDSQGNDIPVPSVRNNTSLPLEMFEARVVGESSRAHEGSFAPGEAQSENLRTLFENDFVSESLFERSWRESRAVGRLQELSVDTSVAALHARASAEGSGHQRSRTNSSRASPSLSVGSSVGSRSTMSAPQSAASSRTQSPALAGADGSSSRKGASGRAKRKASGSLTDESAVTTGSSCRTRSRSRGSTRRITTATKAETQIPIKTAKKRK